MGEQVIFGFPAVVFLLWLSAAFYFVTILLLWRPFSQEKSDLMIALNAFLYGMAFFHIFLGAGFYLNNLFLIHLGGFAALTGSAYTLKFPLSAFPQPWRQLGFYLALAVAWSIIVWLLIFTHPLSTMLSVILIYMIIVTGIAGFYTAWIGIQAKESWVKIKCLGGGVGMLACCFIADLLVLLNGVTLLGEILMSVAPIILLAGLFLGHRLQSGLQPRT